jgi:uncharacterized LabA/DUF88 family protein
VATRTARLHRSHHTGDLSKHRVSPTAGATFVAARRTRLPRKAFSHLRGTEGSNPSPSSGESAANLTADDLIGLSRGKNV